MSAKVNFFLVGCQKSGTTWLHRCLREHPEIYVPEEDEIHFFDIHFHKGENWYNQFYDGLNDERLIGDTTSSYIRDPLALERLAAYNSKAKIIVTLRNPVERAFSHYWHEKKKGKIAFAFEEYRSNYDLFESWIRPGFYTRNLDAYANAFGRDQMLVLIQEEMQGNPDAALKEVYGFLGVDSHFRGAHACRKVNVAPPSKSNQPKTEYELGMHPETRRELEDLFKPEIDDLELWMGRLVSSWKPKYKGIRVNGATWDNVAPCAYFHRVTESTGSQGIDKGNTISTAAFEKWISQVKEERTVVRCSELPDRLSNRDTTRPCVAVSFDDGFRDNLLRALPILEKYNVPATIFITTGFIDGTIIPYEYVLWQFLNSGKPVNVGKGSAPTTIEVNEDNRDNLYDRLRKSVKFEGHAARMGCLEMIGASNELKSWDARNLFLSERELKELAGHPLIDIGAHSVSHVALTRSDSQSLIRELRDSKVRLENLLETSIDLFSYPYGDHNPDVVGAVRACGYRAAFITENDVARPRSAWELPRFNPLSK